GPEAVDDGVAGVEILDAHSLLRPERVRRAAEPEDVPSIHPAVRRQALDPIEVSLHPFAEAALHRTGRLQEAWSRRADFFSSAGVPLPRTSRLKVDGVDLGCEAR